MYILYLYIDSTGYMSVYQHMYCIYTWEMVPSRQTSRHYWHSGWGRTQQKIRSVQVRLCNVCIWLYVYIFIYCTYLYYAHSFERKSTKCKHTHTPRTARFSWTIFSQSILSHISMFFFQNVIHLWTNHLPQTITGWWFQIFVIFISIWGNDPIWLIFFDWVETTN